MATHFYCLKCEKELTDFEIEEDYMFAHNAVILNTHGNYGSRVFDDSGTNLECYLCDPCFEIMATKNFFTRQKSVKIIKTQTVPFDYEKYKKFGV
jgi:hypothetical protein